VKVDSRRDYYAKYRDKEELELIFSNLKIISPVAKFYHIRKFKYLPLQVESEEDG
jgi:hypothetical protein